MFMGSERLHNTDESVSLKVVEGYAARLRREASELERKAAEKWALANQLTLDLNKRRPSKPPERADGLVVLDHEAKTYTWPAENRSVTSEEIEQWERDDEQQPDDALESKSVRDDGHGGASKCEPSICKRSHPEGWSH